MRRKCSRSDFCSSSSRRSSVFRFSYPPCARRSRSSRGPALPAAGRGPSWSAPPSAPRRFARHGPPPARHFRSVSENPSSVPEHPLENTGDPAVPAVPGVRLPISAKARECRAPWSDAPAGRLPPGGGSPALPARFPQPASLRYSRCSEGDRNGFPLSASPAFRLTGESWPPPASCPRLVELLRLLLKTPLRP